MRRLFRLNIERDVVDPLAHGISKMISGVLRVAVRIQEDVAVLTKSL